MFFAFGMLIPTYGQLSTARIAVTQGRLDSVCGTHNVRVVFTSYQDTGYFVDFSEAPPQIRKMANVAKAYFPVISSDGRWITYQTEIEKDGPSTSALSGKVWFRELAVTGTPIKIADTGYVPRFIQNTPADTPTIIYSTSVACPQENCYTVGRTVKRGVVNKTPLQAEVVFNGGSYYGGLSWDNRYLITGWFGGPNIFMLDLLNSAAGPHPVHTMRVKKSGTSIDTGVIIDACNISRSASRIFTNSMLYYDKGSQAVTTAKCYHPILGTWLPHSLLFISRYDAEDLKVFAMPEYPKLIPIADAQGLGEAVGKEWNFPEWSNHPYYGIANLNIDRLWNKSGSWEHIPKCESIYLVALKDSQYVKLIESTDSSYSSTTSFKNPFLWVEVPAGFQEDSNWLAKTIWERSGAVRPFKERKRMMTSDALLSDPRVAEIIVYNLSGRKIVSFPPRAGMTLEKVRNMAGPGSYFIIISSKEKSQEIVRITNIQ